MRKVLYNPADFHFPQQLQLILDWRNQLYLSHLSDYKTQ